MRIGFWQKNIDMKEVLVRFVGTKILWEMQTLQSKKPMKKSDVECGTFVKISEMSILEIEKSNGA